MTTKTSHATSAYAKAAFSLVELSIVLVILGLLTGGILTGQSLIRAAELRSVASEFSAYQTATMTFRDKYFALPGDMNNATDFWGAAHSTPATCVTTASTGSETCNGDNNGQIDISAGSNEIFRFWQHLANAGLTEGSYSGVGSTDGSDSDYAIIGSNVPASKMSNAGWTAFYWGSVSGDSFLFDGNYGNTLTFGAPTTSAGTANPILTPEEGWNIDKKIDDGLPAQGSIVVRGRNGGGNNCTIDSSGAAPDADEIDATYKLSATVLACALTLRNFY